MRSGRERRGSRVAVGRGRRDDKEDEENEEEEEEKDEEEEKRKEEEEETTDIKSNNPHLAGGEKSNQLPMSAQVNPCLAHLHEKCHELFSMKKLLLGIVGETAFNTLHSQRQPCDNATVLGCI